MFVSLCDASNCFDASAALIGWSALFDGINRVRKNCTMAKISMAAKTHFKPEAIMCWAV